VLGTGKLFDRNGAFFKQKHIILLLEVLDPALCMYERVGIVECPLSDPGFMKAEVTSVEIV